VTCLQEKNSPDGLEGVQRRFVKFGGGVSRQQLEWLQQQLQVQSASCSQCLADIVWFSSLAVSCDRCRGHSGSSHTSAHMVAAPCYIDQSSAACCAGPMP